MKEQIIAIIWDWGNVLGRYDYGKGCEELSRYSSKSGTEIKDIIDKNFKKQIWTGALNPATFFAHAKTMIPLSSEMTFAEFSGIWKGIITGENEGVSEILNRLLHIRQCILSDTDPIHWSAIRELPAIKTHFSSPNLVVHSFSVGAVKPSPVMYKEALRRLGVSLSNTHEVLYIEDKLKNCQAFEEMGGKTLNYNCSQEPLANLEKGLKSFGVFDD